LREAVHLMSDMVLKKITGLVGRRADTSREIETPTGKARISVLGPTECNEIKAQRIGDGGIIFDAVSINRRKSVGRKSCSKR